VAGLFGPGSVTWLLGRESAALLAGGRAALLQIAHPYVAHGVAQHSRVFDDLALRFRRTLGTMYAMSFGDRDTALGLARKIHTVHTHIQGTVGENAGVFPAGHPYRANEPAALLWVAATLWDSSVDLFERLVRPLSEDEKARYWHEARKLVCLFGFSSAWLPRDWPDFQQYWASMLASDTLAVTETTRTIARGILAPPRRAAAPLFRLVRIMTTGLLPDRFRRDFELPFGPVERAAFVGAVRALRLGLPWLPEGVRFTPTYLAARRRIAGQPGEDPVAAGMRRLALLLLRK